MHKTNIQPSMVPQAANDAPANAHREVTLRGLAVLLARAHVRKIAARVPANKPVAPTAAPAT